MSEPNELLVDARQAARDWRRLANADLADTIEAQEAAGLLEANFTALDDHMNSGGPPPIDWPFPPGPRLPNRTKLADAIQSDGRSWLWSRADAEGLADHILTKLEASDR